MGLLKASVRGFGLLSTQPMYDLGHGLASRRDCLASTVVLEVEQYAVLSSDFVINDG
ncbi:hypothetical protein OIU76_020543, partial [Salix suchowensis]